MEVMLTNDLRMNIELPMLDVEQFCFDWKPNEHALLKVEGYIRKNSKYRLEQLYGSTVKLWMDRDDKKQILFQGYIVNADRKTIGKTERISLEAMSGSWKLDQQPCSRSFQNVEETYAKMAEQVSTVGGGQVICTTGSDRKIGGPVIQYEETAWMFLKRIASHLGAVIIPDVETGRLNLWFGMREGEAAPPFSEEQYVMKIDSGSPEKAGEIRYEVESGNFYKIGDRSTYLGQHVIIYEVCGRYEHNHLIFSYLLKDRDYRDVIYQSKFAGLGLEGTILDVENELVRIALDIDHGKSTGDYYYDWYPETGNALYAMPEKGAKTMLYFSSVDERESYAIHCLPCKPEEKLVYKERCFDTEDGNSIKLYKETLSFDRGRKHSLALSSGAVSMNTSKDLRIYAEKKIKMKAKRITINTPDKLVISQG